MGLVAVLYARDSSPANSATSIERQFKRGDKHAARVKAIVVARYADEDLTGKTIAGRASLAEMLEAGEKGTFNLLIVEDVSRIGRDGEDVSRIWDRLAACGIAVHEANGTILDPQSLAIKAYLAEQEHATMLGRMQDGRVLAIAGGKMMGAPVYGFCRSPDRAKEHVPHVQRMKVVQRIFKDLASGKPIQSIADAMTAEGEMTPQDCKDMDLGNPNPRAPTRWSYRTVRHIADQTQYVGLVMDGRYRAERDVDDYNLIRIVRQDVSNALKVFNPSLIVVDRETWFAAQKAILPSQPHAKRTKRYKYFLYKKMFCGGCGKPVKCAQANLERYYRCETYCDGGLKIAFMARIEGGIFEIIASAWPKEIACDASMPTPATVDKEKVVVELRQIRVELQALIVASCRGDVPQSTSSMREQTTRLEARATELETYLLDDARAPKAAVDVKDVTGRLRDLIGATTVNLDEHPEAPLLSFVEEFVERVEIVAQDGGYRIEVLMSDAFHARCETGDNRTPIRLWLRPVNDDEAWSRACLERRYALARGKPDAADLAVRSQVQRAIARAEDGSLVQTRLGGVLRCLEGEPARLVAKSIGTDQRVVLAWLHLLRARGVHALVDYPASEPDPARKTSPTNIDHALLEDAYVNLPRSLREKYGSSNTGRPKQIGDTSTIRSFLRGSSMEELRIHEGLKTISAVVRRIYEWEINGSIALNLWTKKVVFDEDFRSFVTSVVMGGYDPDDPKTVMNACILARVLNERYGVTYKATSIPNLMRKLKLRFSHSPNLPTTVARQVVDENMTLVSQLPLDGAA